jgi:hypothetical protein
MKAWQRVTLGAAAPLAAALAACAGQATPPDLSSPLSEELPRGVEAAIEAQIQRSLPQVSYHRPPPDAFGMEAGSATTSDLGGRLEPEQVRSLIRSLESLDGDGRIVCMPSRGRVFGECVFPLGSDAPGSTLE